ncbi:hypothetical protein [Sorangium sp. So ce131]|uniref:hypothetical protein n=1 Tax=Sorangium sp. So ce131 TaxID=3133282 RepID=UPI003F63E579
MSSLRARTIAELARRASVLPRDVERFEAAAAANTGGFGIHASQLHALKILMDELVQRQQGILSGLGADLSDAEFADGVGALLVEIASAHGVWSIFSQALALRAQPALAPPLDAADLVAADCYEACMRRARNWELVPREGLREPPLVCFEAHYTPATVSRRNPLHAVRSSLRRYRDLRLPIPILLLPSDHTECAWLLPLLCHEVGHNVDQDLGISSELARVMLLGMDGKIPSERQDVWYGWTREILADAIGVLLGNAGFAMALASLLLVVASGKQQAELDKYDPHPHPMVRVPLLGAMLRRLGVAPLAEEADRMDERFRALRAPPWLPPFLGDLDAIAGAALGSKLKALGGRAVAELHPDAASDVKRVGPLASFLERGELRPSPDKPSYFPYRLVPVAAQLAIGAGASPERLAAVQQRAMEFFAAIPRPPLLAGKTSLPPQRAAFYAQLARSVDFTSEPTRDPPRDVAPDAAHHFTGAPPPPFAGEG